MDNEIIEKIVKSSDKNKYNDFAYYIKIATGSNEPLMIHAVLLDILKRDDRGSDSQLFFKLTRDVLNYAKSNLGTNDYKDFLNMASGILAQRPLTDRMFILDKMIEADEMHIITEKSFTENLKPLRENLNIALANRKKITDNEKKEKNKREKVIEERKKKEAPIPEKSYSEGIGANITVKDKREKVFINGKAYLLDEKEIKFLKGDPPSKEYLERIKDLEKEVEMVEKSIEEIKANKSVRLDLTNALLTSEDIPQAYVFQTQKITGLKATKEDLLKGQEEFVKVYNECMLSAIEDLSESIVSGKFDETKIKENFLDKKYQVTNVKGKKVSISINEILSGKIAFNRVLLSIAKNENKDTKVLESVNNIISANNISEEMFLLNFVEKIEVAIENKEHSAEEKLTNKEQILIENRLDHVKKSINKAIGEYHNIVASDVNMCLSKDVDITNRLKKEAHNENKIYEGCRLHQMFDGLLSIKKTDADLYKNILPSVAPNIVNIFSKRESEMGEYLVESVAKVYKSKEDYLPAIFDSIQLISEISPNVRDRMVSVFLSELNYNGIMKNMDENKKEEFIAGIEKIANSNSSDKSFYNSIKENLVTKYNFKPTEQIKNERREKEARELELMKEKEAKELALKKEEDRLREERILQAKLREEKEREEARIATIKLEEKKKRDIEATRELIKNLKEAEEKERRKEEKEKKRIEEQKKYEAEADKRRKEATEEMIREHIREEQEIKNKRVQQSPETTDERYKKFRDGKNENDKSDEMTIKRDSDRGIREFVKENSLRQFDEFVKRTDLYFEQSSNEEIFDTLYELIKEDIFKVDKENFLNLTIFSLGYAVKYLDEEEYQRLLEYTSDLIESRDVAERENIVDALIENKKFCLELDSVDDIERTFFGIIASSTNKKDDMSPSYSLFCETLIADDYKLTKGERNELGESNSKVDIILNEFEKFVSLYEKAFKETIANDLINSVTANEFDTESIGFLDKEYDIDYNPGFKTITEQTELQTKITDKEKEIKEAKLDIETREKTILVLGQEEIEGAKLEIETRKEAMLILEQELKQMTQELEQAKQKQQQNSKDTIYGLILDKKTFLKNLDKLPLDEKDKNKLNDLVTKINNIDMDFDYKLSKLENNHKDEMKFIKNTIDDEYNSFLKPSIVKKKKEDLGEQTTIIQLFNSTRRRIIDSTDDDEIANEIDSFIKKIHGTLTLAIDGDISKLKTITKNIYKELEHLDDLFDVNSLSLLRSIEYVESQLTQVLTDGKDISFNTYRKPIDIKFLSNSTQSTLNSTLKSLNSITKDTNEIDIDRMKNNISQLLRENNIKSSATILAKIYDTLNNNDNINKPLLDTILGAIHNTTSEYYAKEPELNSKLYLLTASFISAPAIDNKLPIPISNTDSLQLLCNKSIQDSLSSQISLKIVKDFYKKGLNENMSDFIKTIKDNKDLLSKMVVDISPVALTAFNNSLYINLHLLGETNIGKISIEIAKQTFPSDNFVSEFNNMTTVILEQINSNTLIANPDEKIKSIKRTSLSLYKSFVDERKSIEMRLKNANTYNNKVDTILPNLISSTLLQAKLSQVKDSDSLIVEIIEELKPQGKEITEIVEGIIQFSIPDENNIKKEDLSPIKLVLSSESVSPKLKEELKQSVFNKILNSQNSNCIEQLSELNFTGDIKKDILISSNQEQLTQLFLASKASQEFKKSLLDVLLKSVETSKNKEYLDKINKVLADIVPTFIHTMPRELLPLDKIFKLNPKLANNELVLESICNSDKRSFEDFKLINEKRTLNEKEILKFITETPLRSEQVEQQKDEVLKVFKLITQGKIKSSKTINKFKEEDMRELATFFSKNIDVYTTEIANIFKDNLETKLYKTFNEELAQKLINYVSSPQQQNDNQKQGPQPIVLTTQTKLEERREREKSNSNERENN